MLDDLAKLNQLREGVYGDPEIETRITQYEMAYSMQTSVPELMDISKEPQHVFEMYGEDARKPGTYASHCLLARRLVERGVRFVQLYKRGWDQHNDLPRDLALQCKSVDQPSAALIQDLKQRGLLDDTLVIWGGPHRVLSGHTDGYQLRPRSSSSLLYRLDGRWRHEAGHDHGGNGRLLLQHRFRSGPRARYPGDHSALSRRRPHQAHLQVSR